MLETILWNDWLLPVFWMLFYGYWGVAAFGAAKTQDQTGNNAHRAHITIVVLGLLLTLTPLLRIGLLAGRMVPNFLAMRIAGLFLTMLGLMLAVWARYKLGQYWSGAITLKVDHKLIRSGPYSLLRHPIYSGILLGMLGTALAVNEWRGLLAGCLYLVSYILKARREEAWLLKQFGAQYADFKKQTWAIIPFIY
jgi:protein-S-isoprenylcysteine O-methyltransferase Ste14